MKFNTYKIIQSLILIFVLIAEFALAQKATPTPELVVYNNYQVILKDAKLSDCIDTKDPRLKMIDSPDMKKIHAFKDILPEHFQEWKDSLVRDEIINDNVISIPDVVCQKRNLRKLEFFTPIVDFMGWQKVKVAYNPKIGRTGWIVRGLEPIGFNSDNLLNQIKIIGTNREMKYEDPYVGNIDHINIKNVYLKITSEQSDFIFKNINHIPKQQSNFWKEVFSSDVAVHLTEGAKKAGTLLTIGYPSIGIPGVCAGMHLVDQQKMNVAPSLREDLLELLKIKRIVYIVFDNDKSTQIKEFVQNAEIIFGVLLAKAGAKVMIVDLPGPEKGVDDFIVAHGHEAYRKLLSQAVDIEEWMKKHNMPEGNLALIRQYYACRI